MEAFAAMHDLELLIPEGAAGVAVTGSPGQSGHVVANLFRNGHNGWSAAYAANKPHPHTTVTFPRRVRVDWVYLKVWWSPPTDAPTEFRLFGFEATQEGISKIGRPLYSAVMHQDTDWAVDEELWIEIPRRVWGEQGGCAQYHIDFPTSKSGTSCCITRLNFAQRPDS
jgi:hypothetical protein